MSLTAVAARSESSLTTRTVPPVVFELGEERCVSHPHAVLSEKTYSMPAVGFVLSGWFDYRTEMGTTTAVPGAVVFGNGGQTFTCRHGDTSGNRRLVVVFNGGFLDEVANDCGFADTDFHAAALPPGAAAAAIYGQMRKLARRDEDTAFLLAARALKAGRGDGLPVRPNARSRQRVLSVARHIEETYDQPHTLKSLAAMACLSRHHFLRLFKQVTGESPNQYVIATRLRAAADMLIETRMPIAEVAFASGFRDLSHFNNRFRAVFGCAPRRWRNS